MDVRQGDIYWVDIPPGQTEGSEQYGRRPFVVMSRDAVNKSLKTVIAVPMTTFGDQLRDQPALASQPPYRIVIPATEISKGPSCNSKILTCVAKTDQARVIDRSRFQEKMGRLSQTAVIAVGAGLAFVFDIR